MPGKSMIDASTASTTGVRVAGLQLKSQECSQHSDHKGLDRTNVGKDHGNNTPWRMMTIEEESDNDQDQVPVCFISSFWPASAIIEGLKDCRSVLDFARYCTGQLDY